MSYFPAYAFFVNNYLHQKAAEVIVNNLAQVFTEITLSVNELNEQKEFCFSEQAQVLAFLRNKTTDRHITYLWLANDLHTIKFEFTSEVYIKSDFWDYNSEVYDEGITEELKNEKSQLAVHLLETMIVGCGAEFAYISSVDDEDSGFDIHAEVTSNALLCLKYRDITNLLERPSYFWLIASAPEGILTRTGEVALKNLFQEECLTMEIIIFKHKESQPYFLV